MESLSFKPEELDFLINVVRGFKLFFILINIKSILIISLKLNFLQDLLAMYIWINTLIDLASTLKGLDPMLIPILSIIPESMKVVLISISRLSETR